MSDAIMNQAASEKFQAMKQRAEAAEAEVTRLKTAIECHEQIRMDVRRVVAADQRADACEVREARLEAALGAAQPWLSYIDSYGQVRGREPKDRDYTADMETIRQALSGSPDPVREAEQAVVEAAMADFEDRCGWNRTKKACENLAKLQGEG